MALLEIIPIELSPIALKELPNGSYFNANVWRAYCETGGEYVYVELDENDEPPTQCPNNAEHTIGADGFCIERRIVRKKALFPVRYNSSFGCYQVNKVRDRGSLFVNISTPLDFEKLVSLGVVGIVSKGAAGTFKMFTTSCEYGSDGQLYNQHTSSRSGYMDLTDKANKLIRLDVTALFASLERGDVGGLKVTHGVLGGNIKYIGAEMVYEVI